MTVTVYSILAVTMLANSALSVKCKQPIRSVLWGFMSGFWTALTVKEVFSS